MVLIATLKSSIGGVGALGRTIAVVGCLMGEMTIGCIAGCATGGGPAGKGIPCRGIAGCRGASTRASWASVSDDGSQGVGARGNMGAGGLWLPTWDLEGPGLGV